MTNCIGCSIDTDIECTITISKANGEITYDLCGFCGDKVMEFIKHNLP